MSSWIRYALALALVLAPAACGGGGAPVVTEEADASAAPAEGGPAPGDAAGANGVTAPAASAGTLPVEEGSIDVPGGSVWYRVVAEGDATPLLLLHGGPGATSHYLEPLAALADERPVVFYDQLGCGRSERPDDTDLWTTERFVEELVQVRQALGLDRVHILGHSWGSMLAVEYLLTRDPEGVESLVLAGPALSIPRWLADADALRAELPADVQETLARHEEAGTTGSEEYQAATMVFYQRHLCRLDPWPPEMERAFAEFGQSVYETMWGPTEFHATGSLKEFDRSDRLGELDLPVLYTAGRYDEATPEAVAWYQSLTPGSEARIFENSSHMSMLEEPEAYVAAVREFLARVEDAGQ